MLLAARSGSPAPCAASRSTQGANTPVCSPAHHSRSSEPTCREGPNATLRHHACTQSAAEVRAFLRYTLCI